MRAAAGGLAASAGLVVTTGLALFVGIVSGTSGAGASSAGASLGRLLDRAASACVVRIAPVGLTPAQATDASEVVAAALGDSATNVDVARIALMVADTESSLVDLGPLPGNDGSLGLFQQRVAAGWGTAAEEEDPAEATAMFVDRLLAVPHWADLPPWVAAEDVQRSAFDGIPSPANGMSPVVGGNYEAHWRFAGSLLARILRAASAPGACGQGVPGGLPGPSGRHGLPAGYRVPPGTPPAHAAVVAYALRQLGKRYVFGAAGPDAFDCSGLTMAAWATVGVPLQHYTVDQQHEGVAVTLSALEPGDLVLAPGVDSPGPGLAGHVGIYLGDRLVESAIDPAMGVAVRSWSTFTSGGLVALRNPDPADRA